MVVKIIKPGYRITEIGAIPDDWLTLSLKDSCALIKDGTHTPPKRINSGIPLLSAVNIENGEIDFHNNITYISENDYKLIQKFHSIKRGDVLITIVGTLGRSALVNSDQKFSVQRSIAVLRPLNNKIDNEYFFQILNSKKFLEQILLYSKSTAQTGIYLNELARILIPVPKKEEQVRISEILSNADATIKSLHELVNKKRNIKKGLIQALLTRGIGHTKFKKTEIREIPEEWELKSLGDNTVSIIEMGQSPPSSSYNETRNGLPFLQGNAEFGFKYPSTNVYCSSPLKKALQGDILISVRAPVGAINVSNVEYCIGRGLAAIRPNPNRIDKTFMYYSLKGLKGDLERLSAGSTFKAIGKNQLYGLKIPLPPLPEQQKIARTISDADKEIKALEEKIDKYKRLKTGMMQQLLTGGIRVK